MGKNTLVRKAKKFAVNLVDNPALVLMYHRVVELERDPFELAVSPDRFYKQIEYLKTTCNIIDPDDLVSIRKSGKPLPKKSIVITFDDGYLDNYTGAIPVLEHFDAGAIFFIATANIDRKNDFWSDSLGRVLYETEGLPKQLAVNVNAREYGFDVSTTLGRDEAFKKLHFVLKQTNPPQREEVVGIVLDWAGLSRDGRDSHRFMSSEEVKCLSKSRIATIGSHTHNHPRLSSLAKKDQYEEISKSLEILQTLTSRSVKHFSYPYGSNSEYDSNSVEICKNLGFDLAYGGWGVVYRWADDYQLPRINVGNWDIDTFKAKLAYLI